MLNEKSLSIQPQARVLPVGNGLLPSRSRHSAITFKPRAFRPFGRNEVDLPQQKAGDLGVGEGKPGQAREGVIPVRFSDGDRAAEERRELR